MRVVSRRRTRTNMGVRTITDGLVQTLPKPKPGNPLELVSIGDHIRKRRMDLGLTRKAAAEALNVDQLSLKNWEEQRTQAEVRFYPAIIGFLGYNPLPESQTFGEAVRLERETRGLSRKALAAAVGVDEGTIKRLEIDTPRMARRPIKAVCEFLSLARWMQDPTRSR